MITESNLTDEQLMQDGLEMVDYDAAILTRLMYMPPHKRTQFKLCNFGGLLKCLVWVFQCNKAFYWPGSFFVINLILWGHV